MTSRSDLERIDKLMKFAPHANKYIVKYFGSQLEEFRRLSKRIKEDMFCDIVLGSELPEPMLKHLVHFDSSSTVTLSKELSGMHKDRMRPPSLKGNNLADEIISSSSVMKGTTKMKIPRSKIKLKTSVGGDSPARDMSKSSSFFNKVAVTSSARRRDSEQEEEKIIT